MEQICLRDLPGSGHGFYGLEVPGIFWLIPQKTSACKRSHLFLRWMVRKDQVDPGGWSNVPTAALTCPVDAHMFKIGHMLGFTTRRSADGVCAAQITQGFRRICPEDPVKYDFCLTRFGIRDGLDMSELKRFLKDDDYDV